jgi:phosphocarrier protein
MPTGTQSQREIVVRELIIQNQTGLHARPAAAFVKTANSFRAKITVTKGEDSVNGKSIMGLMTLAAANGTKLVIEAKGDDAVAAADALQSLVEKNFNEA